jgi:two-component system, NtrC family, sensor histidine kinase KinB
VKLRTKLVLAQLPLLLALGALGVFAGLITSQLGRDATRILTDNHRSVLTAQRIKDLLDRIDRLALTALVARAPALPAELAGHRQTLDRELRAQEANITEPDEAAATARLREVCRRYEGALDRYPALGQTGDPAGSYQRDLAPAVDRAKAAADQILAINHAAMVRKSEGTQRRVEQVQALLPLAVLIAALLGLLASIGLTARLLRPLGIVAAAVRRFGSGDLGARARVQGRDEIAQLAGEFNTMADRLERYRHSSLGELLQAQQAAQAAIDGLPDPVVLLQAGGGLLGVNSAAGSVLGIDPERSTGDPLAVVDPGIRAVLDRFRAHVLGGKGAYLPRGYEEAIRLAASEGERIFLPRASPIYGESGEVTGVAVVYQDITRLFRFDELKNNLVSTVAHEFRTPLTSLRMAIHLCLEEAVGPLTAKQADMLHAAREDCARLQDIVDDLLNLARIESGRIDLHRRRVEARTLIDQAIDVHRLAAQDRRVTLRAAVLPGCPEAFADPDRLQLVFSNLISNAIRHSPAGGEIQVSARPDAPGWLRFEVQDQGPGIPPEHQPGLFEKFFRVPGSPAGGSGLGLFIAHGIVQAHGGHIGLLSPQGQGATFWFTLPTADVSDDPAAGAPA